MKQFSVIVLISFGIVFNLLSEGSRTLAPNYGGTGSIGTPGAANNDFAWLEHDSGISGSFLDPSAPANERLYVYLKAGETLYWGLNRVDVRYQAGVAYSTATQEHTAYEDLWVIIRANDGTQVQSTELSNTGGNAALTGPVGGGVISTVASSLIGPAFTFNSTNYNVGGYTPISYTNNTGSDQDFYIEFLQDEEGVADINVRSWYDLWDFSVYNGSEEKPGRLHCQRWGITAQYFDNRLADEASFYVQVPSTIGGVLSGNYIKQVDLGGLDPFSLIVYANSTGADAAQAGTSDFLELRRSQTTEIALIEYNLFLNNPDIELYPTTTLPTVEISDAVFYCNTAGTGGEGTIYFETNQLGFVSILVDLNGVSGYQSGTTDVIIEQEVTSTGSQVVRWDGLDGLSAIVPSNTDLTITGRFTAGPIHVPLFDVESSPVGLQMLDTRPSTSFDLIYWDDTNVTSGASPTVELDGTNTDTHIWTDGDNVLINTWSFGYFEVNSQNVTYTYNCDEDGDGVNNGTDLDSDNDGISNAVEGDHLNDTDADNIPDYVDIDFAGFVDSNGDGINDNFDTDLDGIPNALDVDSDNDGIPDMIENGLTDANNDGTLDEGSGITDANGNGLDDNYDALCINSAAAGNADAQTNTGVTNPGNALGAPNANFAELRNGDILTLDLTDIVPSGETVVLTLSDTNTGGAANGGGNIEQSLNGTDFSNSQAHTNTVEDPTTQTVNYVLTSNARYIRITRTSGRVGVYGVSYSFNSNPCGATVGTAITPPNTDGDGVANYLDLDSDNDGIVDVTEAGGTAGTDGRITSFTDTDGNGRNDAQEVFALSIPDTDADGTLPNYLDLDSDNDGISDNVEGQASNIYIATAAGDTDSNGLLDVYDPNNGGTLITPVNTDGTGNADYFDTDADGDGVLDVIEGHDANSNGFGDWDATGSNNDITDETGYNVDTDSDGLWDIFDTDNSGTTAPTQNTDGAGLSDWQDTDDDDDGSLTSGEDINTNGNWADDFTQGGVSIPDYLYRGDFDGDAISDALDADSDNDGITDATESNGESIDPSGDEDGDGVANYRDASDATVTSGLSSSADVNGDGVYDVYDSDFDGKPDFLDLDSDNDGILDAIEANNGSVPFGLDTSTGQFQLQDPDNDGLMNYVDTDDVTATNPTSDLANSDTDSDGVRDYLDIDSDRDGIVDNIESQTTSAYIASTTADTDGDGIRDVYDPNNGGTLITPVNTDGLDLQDYIDTDSDNDGVLDIIEGDDTNSNGYGDWDVLTQDNDITNETNYNTDTDGDGLDDIFDTVTLSGNGNGNEVGTNTDRQNTDGTDERDWRDTNDDNDSALTSVEDVNTNGDWTDDQTQGQGGGVLIPDYLFNADNDEDGIVDTADLDSDNDGLLDTEEANGESINPSGDVDADGIPNYRDQDDTGVTNNIVEVDSNGDGVWDNYDSDLDGTPDFQDLDSDNDGISDIVEAGGVDADGNGLVDSATDTDNDGYVDTFDSDDGGTALNVTDKDGDGLRDGIDLDSDNDGIPDILETSGTDSNNDGKVDNTTDTDADGFADIVDTDNGGTNYTIVDTDSDGNADYLDVDSDNDGITDTVENEGTDSNFDGKIDAFSVDTDGDGWADVVDSDNGGTVLTVLNVDGDSYPNYRDLDSDNDGLQDILEGGGTDSDNDGMVNAMLDADADGIPNSADVDIIGGGDTDGDGISDTADVTQTGGNDDDGDGIDNNFDPDDDGNGFDDATELTPFTVLDTDKDGRHNFFDIDSDNDGIPDISEFFGVTTSTGSNGMLSSFTDANANGWNDGQDGSQGGTVINPIDSDSGSDPVNIPDYLDLDSDNDGIVDNIEAQTKLTYVAPSKLITDSDHDGLDDVYDPDNGGTILTPVNTDGAGNADYLDADSDADTVNDNVEGDNANKNQYADWDANTNATFDDTGFNSDVDGDGILDIFDSFSGTGNGQVTGSGSAVQDTDNDGIWDFQDVDDDNDLINTTTDGNGDGDPTNDFNDDPANIIPDYLYGNPDHDGDGLNDTADVDTDNDGLADTDEDGGTGIDPSGDIDSDGLLNYEDPDIDGDGNLNTVDTNGDGSGTNTTGFTDTNADNTIDNFDKDLDGIPDFRDLDSDNDGILDLVELGQTDSDNDGIVDGFTDVSGGVVGTTYTISSGCSTTFEATGGHATGPTVDDGNVNPTLPFNFDFYGTTFNSGITTTLNSNGFYSLDNINPGSPWNAVSVPNATYTNTIFMNHRDWDPSSGGTVTYGTNGTGPNRIFVVTFSGVPYFGANTNGTMQLQLYETTNEIRIVTTLFTPDDGDNHTMGINVDGTTGDTVSGRNLQNYTITTAECQSFVPMTSLGNNGRDDTIDGAPLSTIDTDSDGISNHHDLDSDNDGITDNREAQLSTSYIAPAVGDSDADGILDVYDANNGGTGITPVNTESTGNADYIDTDSDDDGVLDIVEGWDANSNGFADWDTDSDNDITDEAGYNIDTDSDGLWFIFDSNQGLGQLANIDGSNQALQDTDSDDVADADLTTGLDYRDSDDDGDGALTSSTGTGNEDANNNGNWIDDFSQGGGAIPNYLYNPDVDGDGIVDQTDLDSDNDGVLNTDEYTGAVYGSGGTPFDDADGDGIYNYLDTSDVNNGSFTDANGDGVDDQVDQDRDGVPNFFDLDSDNDGILDGIEANDGAVPTGFSTTTGRFGVDNSGGDDDDDDNDGLNDNVDTSTGGTALAKSNLDSDALDDYLDLDSDNDGVTDNVESQATVTAPSGTDTDGDGWDNNYDPSNGGTSITPVNSDGTDEPDYRDTNSDNDLSNGMFIGDIVEAFDANRNGFSDLDLDQDGDLSDQSGYNVDTDGDGLWDLFDTFSGYGNSNITGSNANLQDTDNDGTLDFRDTDDDNDNITTTVEDVDSDGIWTNDKVQGGGATPDYLYFNDSDGDLIADGLDVDGDNDGIPNNQEYNFGTDPGPFNDADGDGVFNYNDPDNPGGLTDSNADGIWDEYDLDLDGVPNVFDLDSDNDGIPDIIEAGGTDVDGDGQIDGITDTDGDGLLDTYDVDQTGGADVDGDDIDDLYDISVLGSGTDLDGDDVRDDVDRDDDGDGVIDTFDTDEGGTALTVPDTDSDTIVDMWDLDTDNDGIVDLEEGGGSDTNGDGQLDGFGDTDGDGWGNTVDSDNGGTALTVPNTDGAGDPNYMDQDSDGDGKLDYNEGFDDDEDGDALADNEDYEVRATAYGNASHYNPNNLSWLSDFRTFGSGNYRDSDGDGIIDLYDVDAGGNFYGNVSGKPDNENDGIENYIDVNDAGLPLDFLDFIGYYEDGVVQLEWITTNEVNVSHFDVEYSTDGKEFSTFGNLDAVNIESLVNTYNFMHLSPVEGFNYYRVTQNDFDGKFESSKTISVYTDNNKLMFDLYPNPTSNFLNIRTSVNVPSIILNIVDLTGSIIHRQILISDDVNVNHEIDISRFKPGMYHVIMDIEGNQYQYKVIKH